VITVTSLASGSSGNALLIQCASGALLVDCGVPQRTIERQLRYVGLAPAQLTAILLTHEHGDHACSAGPLARRWRVPVVCNGPTRAALGGQLSDVEVLEWQREGTIGPFSATSFPILHDAAAPVGYLIRVERCAIGVAIDLGSWNEDVVAGLRPADLLVVEANHDRERLMASPYPWSIRHRIMSDHGHLDNVQAGALLARVAADGRPRHVWLAHLSEQTNSPEIAVRMVGTTLSMAGVRGVQITALPRRQTVRWNSDQLMQQESLWSSEF
jgi:phosphoribosyl 1,2-cyclic phosphodiesterase